MYIAVDENAGRARERMDAALERLYGHRVASIEAAAVTGTPADCVRDVRAVAEAGAELILFTPLFDQAEHAERLAERDYPGARVGACGGMPGGAASAAISACVANHGRPRSRIAVITRSSIRIR